MRRDGGSWQKGIRSGKRSHPNGARRLKVVAEGRSRFGGAQLALDASFLSPLHWDGTATLKGRCGRRRRVEGDSQKQ